MLAAEDILIKEMQVLLRDKTKQLIKFLRDRTDSNKIKILDHPEFLNNKVARKLGKLRAFQTTRAYLTSRISQDNKTQII